MLRFFRNIRLSLLTRNKIGKYVLYAIGEILLVVIGILIALQVDNWNKERDDLAYQEAVLEEIRKALESDIVRYQENIQLTKHIDSGVAGMVRLMGMDVEKVSENDFFLNISRMFVDLRFTYNAGAYEGLKASGLEKIQNPGLRSHIINYYEVMVPDTKNNIEEYLGTFDARETEIRETLKNEGIVESVLIQEPDSLVRIGVSTDYEKMLTHRLFEEELKIKLWKSSDYRRFVNDLIGKTESLIEEIDVELVPK